MTFVFSNFRLGDEVNYYSELFKFEDDMAQCGRWFSPTVTTNYDLVFERCAEGLKIEHRACTGFQKLQNMRDKVLPLERIILEGG
jgi:hypothetical protein